MVTHRIAPLLKVWLWSKSYQRRIGSAFAHKSASSICPLDHARRHGHHPPGELDHMIRRVYLSFFFLLALVSNVAFKLTKATQNRRLSTFPAECSYPCTHTTVDLLLKKGQQTCPKTIQEGDKFVTGGGIDICRALRGGEVRSTSTCSTPVPLKNRDSRFITVYFFRGHTNEKGHTKAKVVLY